MDGGKGGGETGEVHRYKFPRILGEEAYTADLNRVSGSSYSCGKRNHQIAYLALEKIYTVYISNSPVSANLDYDKNYLIKSEGGQAVSWSLLDFTLSPHQLSLMSFFALFGSVITLSFGVMTLDQNALNT